MIKTEQMEKELKHLTDSVEAEDIELFEKKSWDHTDRHEEIHEHTQD